MYSAKFISSTGETFLLGVENGIVFDIVDLGGVDINLGITSRFSQIGSTVTAQSIDGKDFLVKGVIFDNIVETKKRMGRIFSPFENGRLEFNNEYFIDATIKRSIQFNPKIDDGTFAFQFFAPVPFFKKIEKNSFSNYKISGAFRFPMNYSNLHRFAYVEEGNQIIVSNNGHIRTPFEAKFTTPDFIVGFEVSDIYSGKSLKFNGELSAGDTLKMSRDEYGNLRITLEEEGVESDAFFMLDESSDLFEFEKGNTVIERIDSNGGTLRMSVAFNEMIGAVYEH